MVHIEEFDLLYLLVWQRSAIHALPTVLLIAKAAILLIRGIVQPLHKAFLWQVVHDPAKHFCEGLLALLMTHLVGV